MPRPPSSTPSKATLRRKKSRAKESLELSKKRAQSRESSKRHRAKQKAAMSDHGLSPSPHTPHGEATPLQKLLLESALKLRIKTSEQLVANANDARSKILAGADGTRKDVLSKTDHTATKLLSNADNFPGDMLRIVYGDEENRPSEESTALTALPLPMAAGSNMATNKSSDDVHASGSTKGFTFGSGAHAVTDMSGGHLGSSGNKPSDDVHASGSTGGFTFGSSAHATTDTPGGLFGSSGNKSSDEVRASGSTGGFTFGSSAHATTDTSGGLFGSFGNKSSDDVHASGSTGGFIFGAPESEETFAFGEEKYTTPSKHQWTQCPTSTGTGKKRRLSGDGGPSDTKRMR